MRKLRRGINVQVSTWIISNAGDPQGSILNRLSLLIYVNGLSHNLSSNVKLFVYNTSLFSAIHDISISSRELNEELKKKRIRYLIGK